MARRRVEETTCDIWLAGSRNDRAVFCVLTLHIKLSRIEYQVPPLSVSNMYNKPSVVVVVVTAQYNISARASFAQSARSAGVDGGQADHNKLFIR